MTILQHSVEVVVVIVLVAEHNHSSDDDYPLQPILSKPVAAAAAAVVVDTKSEVAHRDSAYDVGWVYHHHHHRLSWKNVVEEDTHLYCEKVFF